MCKTLSWKKLGGVDPPYNIIYYVNKCQLEIHPPVRKEKLTQHVAGSEYVSEHMCWRSFFLGERPHTMYQTLSLGTVI